MNDLPGACTSPADAGPRTALVLIPETVNFFNNVAGRRLTQALTGLGWKVQLRSLRHYAGERAEVAFLVSILELFKSCESPRLALKNMEAVRSACPKLIMWLLEPTSTPWFDHSYQLFRDLGLEMLADCGLLDQSGELTPEQRRVYYYVFYGLTEAEKARVRNLAFQDELRTIPWVFVGYKTPVRCELARFLIEEIDRRGFLYLTGTVPITETGPHLQEASFLRVLQRCRYHLWRAHHSRFFLEGERFRYSALAGCLPFKVVVEDVPGEGTVPFSYLIIRKDELRAWLDPSLYTELRRRFLEEYCQYPSLEAELTRLLTVCRAGPEVVVSPGPLPASTGPCS